MKEEWRDVVGYEGLYQVSNLGRIKSLDRIDPRGCRRKSMILKQDKNECGYLKISLCKNNKTKRFRVHRLVAIAFISNPEGKPEVNHIDGNKSNNSVSNLEWCTTAENLDHAYRTGLKVSKKKLTWDIVHYIREHYIKGDKEFGETPLARKFGVDHATVRDVINNKSWRED